MYKHLLPSRDDQPGRLGWIEESEFKPRKQFRKALIYNHLQNRPKFKSPIANNPDNNIFENRTYDVYN